MFRRAVQQEMMNPHTMLNYIGSIDHVCDQVIHKIDTTQDSRGFVDDINTLCNHYVFETVAIMLIGIPTEILSGKKEGVDLFNNSVNIINAFKKYIIGPSIYHKLTGTYQKMLRLMTDFNAKCQTQIHEAIAKHEQDGSLEGTVLGALIKKHGADSNIPVMMAVDSMNAGGESTGKCVLFTFIPT